MRVRTYQLDDLFWKVILLSNTKLVPNDAGYKVDIEGTIEYIGDEKGKWDWIEAHPGVQVTQVYPLPYEGCNLDE